MNQFENVSVEMTTATQHSLIDTYVRIKLSAASQNLFFDLWNQKGSSKAFSLYHAILNEMAISVIEEEIQARSHDIPMGDEVRKADEKGLALGDEVRKADEKGLALDVVLILEEVFCTLQVEGTHNWSECPFEEVGYLRDDHRHVFHIKAYQRVTHSDRDVEFIMLKHQIISYLENQYYIQSQQLHAFGSMSCEMIGRELMNVFDLSRVEVSEDGENGALLLKCLED